MMKIIIKQLDFSMYIGDLPWEKTHLQKVSLDLEIIVAVNKKPPDYWIISKGILKMFSKSHYEWVEDLAYAIKRYLDKNWNLKGQLVVSKCPKVPQSPKVFQVVLPL